MLATATAVATGWPPNVEPCTYEPIGESNSSVTNWPRMTTPPRGWYAEVTPLAKVIMSGTTPLRSLANQWPKRPNEQMTSSATSSTPCSSQIRRSSCQ